LFTLYINDLSYASKFETKLCADDAALMLSGKDINDLNEKTMS